MIGIFPRLLLSLYVLALPSRAVEMYSGTDSLIQVLVKAVEEKESAVFERVGRIDALRKKLSTADPNADVFPLYNRLFQENRKFIYDSAFKYATLMIRTAHREKNKERIGYARSQLGYILVSSGFFKEAFDTLMRVRVKYLPDSAKAEFYALVARGYYDLAQFDDDSFYRRHYTDLGNVYTDSARSLCVPGSYYDLYLSRIKNIKTENFAEALKDSEALRSLFTLSWESQAVNFYDLSHAHLAMGRIDEGIEFLVHSAYADLKSATKETAAMHALARVLYERGEIDAAYIFIQQAREDALHYGARQRQLEISAVLPLIATAKLNSMDAQRRKWLIYSTALTILIILVVAFLFIIFRQLRKLKAAEQAISAANLQLLQTNRNLSEANQIKEEYIGYYFNINAEYLNKIEAFKKAIDQKVTARKFDDLRYIVDNINLKREREDLSYSFDRVFLNLFPDFVSTFNSFFKPEDQIVLKEGQLLNTELRIFALIRMGISDTDKIARILGYSVNTIYAYKNRLKSKSILPNEEFESRIMQIKTA
jgi:hypothetical protein